MNSQEPRPLRALVVSGDRPLLRHVSQFLSAFEYEVWQAEGKEGGLALCEAVEPEFVLLDASRTTTEQLDACRAMKSALPGKSPFIFWLSAPLSALEMTEVLEAGADDFLGKPLVYGEALARLRAGARLLEHRRRTRGQHRLDPETGVLSAAAFNRALSSVTVSGSRRHGAACVMADLDAFNRFALRSGQKAASDLLREVVRKMVEVATDAVPLGRCGHNRFVFLLRQKTEPEAATFAEKLRQTIAATTFKCAGEPVHLTVSCGVATAADEPSKTYERLETALRGAKASGRNFVARYGQFDDETRSWSTLAQPGKLLETTTARHIMTPCALTLNADDTARRAKNFLERAHVAELPAVDGRGKLLGVVQVEKLSNGHTPGPDDERLVSDVVDRNVATFDEAARFSTVMEFFSRDPRPVAVVLHQDQPIGILSRNSILALSRPLQTSTFHATSQPSLESNYLVVPDLIAVGEQ
jgi:two-component system cell cycle response regulator